MWTCPSCGEQHEDQFRECWKCFGKELEHAVTATPPLPKPPAPPRTLRSNSSILVRTLIGAVVGMVLGEAVFHASGVSPKEVTGYSAVAGAVFAACVGIFFWVLFPYEPVGNADQLLDEPETPRHSPD
jgi:hypothetical protein